MNCPYCERQVDGMTGLIELRNFQRHLAKCTKNPNNIVLREGWRIVVTPKTHQDINEALKIRAESGQ